MNNPLILLTGAGLAGLAAVAISNADPVANKPSCKARVHVEIKTAADKDQQGRIVIAEWKRTVERQHGSQWTNFKIATEPVVKCRQIGNAVEATCWAEGNPCRS